MALKDRDGESIVNLFESLETPIPGYKGFEIVEFARNVTISYPEGIGCRV